MISRLIHQMRDSSGSGTGIVCLNPSRDRLPFTSQGDVKGKGAGQLCWIASILCKKQTLPVPRIITIHTSTPAILKRIQKGQEGRSV